MKLRSSFILIVLTNSNVGFMDWLLNDSMPIIQLSRTHIKYKSIDEYENVNAFYRIVLMTSTAALLDRSDARSIIILCVRVFCLLSLQNRVLYFELVLFV